MSHKPACAGQDFHIFFRGTHMTTLVRGFDPIALGAGCAALMRPHQWIKNGFVLVGLVFSHRWDDLGVAAALAFWPARSTSTTI
jgi:hypothetical protein